MDLLLAGGSGLVGNFVAAFALADPRVSRIHALVRKRLELSSPKLEQHLVEFASLGPLPGGQVAISCLGTTIAKAKTQENFMRIEHGFNLGFARRAKDAGVQKFVLVSAMEANKDSKIFYSRVKGQIDEDVKALGFESLVILRPSLLLGQRKETRRLEGLAIKLEPVYAPILVGPLRRFRPVHAASVARAILHHAFADSPGLTIVSNAEILSFSQ